MSSTIHLNNNVAYLEHSQAAVFFSENFSQDKVGKSKVNVLLQKIVALLDVAPWGEDNRFPQNIVKHLAKSGVSQSTLNWKAKSYWGSGLVYGKVKEISADGTEVFQIAKKGEFPDVDLFWKDNNIPMYFAESNLDFAYFANCFPELIFSQDKKRIAGIVHQESCDCRWKQMNAPGVLDTIFISKLWGATADQFVKFDADKSVTNISKTLTNSDKVDGKYIVEVPAVDMYFPLNDAKELAKKENVNSFILPINYPSPNKTYYQLASWDGCRLSGWIEISAQIPAMLKALYKNAFTIRYHIEIPEDYFEKRYGKKDWAEMDAAKRRKAREEVLQLLDDYLSGTDNTAKTFISYFEVDQVTKDEIGRIKITVIDNKNNTDKDLLASGTANSEIMFSMGVNPNILGAGKPGGVYASNQGGSNIREGKLEHDSSLHLERQLLLSPFYLIKEFNNWPSDLEFRFRDTVLTTLDTGKQTETQIK